MNSVKRKIIATIRETRKSLGSSWSESTRWERLEYLNSEVYIHRRALRVGIVWGNLLNEFR